MFAEANANANTFPLSLCGSVSDRPAAALGTLQAVSREGPGLLPERRRVLRHRDAQRATQALQVSDRNHNVAAVVVGKHLLYLLLLPPEHHSSSFFILLVASLSGFGYFQRWC